MLVIPLICLGGCSYNPDNGSTVIDSVAETDDGNTSETAGEDNGDLHDPGKITVASGSSISKEDLLGGDVRT